LNKSLACWAANCDWFSLYARFFFCVFFLFVIMAIFVLYLSAFASLSQCTGAFPPFDYEGAALKGTRENASFYDLPEHPLKFQSFYPQLQEVLYEISTGPCFVSLQAYEGNLTARREVS
jgi:hypothetical protein